ncbi:MAG: hypothetical protein IJF74_01200 [Clostridia bacterium]|nr:hypothetical protein [Clostridia bacterium]
MLTKCSRTALAAVFAVIGAVCVFFGAPLPPGGSGVTAVFYAVILLPVFFAAIRYAIPLAKGEPLIYSVILGTFFSICSVTGTELFIGDTLDLSFIGVTKKLLLSAGIAPAAISLTLIAIRLLTERLTLKEQRLTPAKTFFFSWGTILLLWLPCFIAFFPGIYSYDIPTQIEGISYGTLTSDHPLLHTVIVWWCLRLGAALHSYTLGAAIYSFLQMCVLSASFAAAIAYMNKKNVSPKIQLAALAWFALVPMNPLFAINVTKDVLFAAFTLLFFIQTAELVSNPKSSISSPRFWVLYVLTVAVMSLVRNTGIYPFLMLIPITVALVTSKRVRILLLCILCAVSFFASNAILGRVLDVKEGRFTEILSVPLQQVARCARDGALNEEELAEVEKFIPREIWQQYSSRLADQIKNYVDREYLEENFGEFLRLWSRLGFKHSGCYLKAFLGLNIGYWYPAMQYPDTRTWHDYIETIIKPITAEVMIYDLNLWPEMRELYQNIAKTTVFEAEPISATLHKPGIYFWATLVLFSAAIIKRNRTSVTLTAFLLISWLMQMFSPIALLRYVYPFIVCIPTVIGTLSENNKKSG